MMSMFGPQSKRKLPIGDTPHVGVWLRADWWYRIVHDCTKPHRHRVLRLEPIVGLHENPMHKCTLALGLSVCVYQIPTRSLGCSVSTHGCNT
jgi:hypothetical protein